jgi:prepilin-type N-terminal cleavage/methylation domain-containing protein
VTLKFRSGLTLIEMLMVISLIALVGMAVYGIFSSGINVMRLVTRPVSEENLNIFFEKLARDLQNSFNYTGISFEGENDKFSFAAKINAKPELGGERGIGRVTYFYDSGRDAISRREEDLNLVFEESFSKPAAQFGSVLEAKFLYFAQDPATKQYLWKDDWVQIDSKKKLPLAVRVEFEYKDENGRHSISKTIPIPAGG